MLLDSEKALLAEVTEIVNRNTWHRRRMEAMGFKFQSIKAEYTASGVFIQADFLCVCGQHERLGVCISGKELLYGAVGLERHPRLDPALMLHDSGSFSRDHLVADGYTETQIQEILKRGEDFDEAHSREACYV